jgi:hypothetical protein
MKNRSISTAPKKVYRFPASLQQKLQLKSGQVVLILNSPPGYLERLMAELKENDVSAETRVNAEAIVLFINNQSEAKDLVPSSIRAVKPDGLLWIAYPKGTSKIKTDVNRDSPWETVIVTGWRPVRLIALDETWSVMRFRPVEKVGRKANLPRQGRIGRLE